MTNSLNTLLRLVVIIVVMIVAVLLILAVVGVLSSSVLRDSIAKIGEIALIILLASGITLFVAKNKS